MGRSKAAVTGVANTTPVFLSNFLAVSPAEQGASRCRLVSTNDCQACASECELRKQLRPILQIPEALACDHLKRNDDDVARKNLE